MVICDLWIACFRSQFLNVISIPSEEGLFLENPFNADGFLLFILTQGCTPSSFAQGYKYFAHTGLNPRLFPSFQVSRLLTL